MRVIDAVDAACKHLALQASRVVVGTKRESDDSVEWRQEATSSSIMLRLSRMDTYSTVSHTRRAQHDRRRSCLIRCTVHCAECILSLAVFCMFVTCVCIVCPCVSHASLSFCAIRCKAARTRRRDFHRCCGLSPPTPCGFADLNESHLTSCMPGPAIKPRAAGHFPSIYMDLLSFFLFGTNITLCESWGSRTAVSHVTIKAAET